MKKTCIIALTIITAFLIASCVTTAGAASGAASAPAPAASSGSAELTAGSGAMIWIEAEDGIENMGVWEIKDGKSASGGKYIVTAAAKTKNTPTVNGSIKYVFNVENAGKYMVFVRYMAKKEGDKSYFFEINGAPPVRSDHDNNWDFDWNFFNNDNPGRPLYFDLPAGENTIIIHHREPSTALDKFLITDNLTLKPADVAKM